VYTLLHYIKKLPGVWCKWGHSSCFMLFRNGHLSYWGISAVAETTWVDPGVLDCMCGHVHLQTRCIGVSFIAVGALVGLVFVVLTPVGLGKKCLLETKQKPAQMFYIVKDSGHQQHMHCIRRKLNSFTPVNLRVAWRISRSLDGCTCRADRRCESWMANAKNTYMNIDGSPISVMVT